MTLLETCIVALPIAILLFGPRDAVVWSLIDERRLRTWHLETAALGIALAAVVLLTGDSWTGWACWMLAHSQRSISARIREAYARMPGGRVWLHTHVGCMAWGGAQSLLALVVAVMYLVPRSAYVALAGLVCDVLYRWWRAWHTRRDTR